MKSFISYFNSCCLISIMLMSLSCSGRKADNQSDDNSIESYSIQVDSVDSLIVVDNDTVADDNEKIEYNFSDSEEILSFIDSREDAALYKGGIIPVIAHNVPAYATKLLSELETYSSFIIVDKASMRVLLYDKYGQIIRSYDMACAKNYGTKHKKADSRTPEGFFSVEGKYDSTDWLFTDDDGVTSKKKGQFGPRFIRIKTPVSMQIGIHGTGSPWSLGHRVSHGCIRISNDNIMELFGLVEKGMPVIVLPGKRDRAVNREEGYDIAYFPTDKKYAMSEAEKKEKVNTDSDKENKENKDSVINQVHDSISVQKPNVDRDVEIDSTIEQAVDSISKDNSAGTAN